MDSKIDYTSIKNILTIRYDPTKKSPIKHATPNDFIPKTFDSDGKHTLQLLQNSIKNNISDYSKISLSLSGGIDSTLMLGLIRKTLPKTKITAFCGIFEDGFDESVAAKKMAEKFDADFVPINMTSIFTFMPEIISMTKKPKWNTYIHLIAKNAKKFSKNFVTGDGADEIFGGYIFRYSKFQNLLQKRDSWKIKTINYLECHNRDWVPDQELMFGKSLKFDWNKIFEYFKPYFQNKLEPLQQVMLADFNGKLAHDFIPMGNSIAKYYGIQNFSPFLDNEVISFGLSLDTSEKYDRNSKKGKLVLRKIAKKLGIEHIEEKRGFSPSILFDWKKHGREICNQYILKKDSYIFQKKIINYNWVLRSYEKVENDGDIRYLNRLVSILALEIWYRIFISKEMNPKKKL